MVEFITFPKTNPIVFSKEGEYDAYMDAESREVTKEFCQQFHENDLISFQFQEEIKNLKGFQITVTVNEKSYLIFWHFMPVTGRYIPDNYFTGSRPSEFLERKNRKGIFCFSKKLKEIKDSGFIGGVFPRLIKNGDNFHFEILFTYDNNNTLKFISNKLVCKNDTTGTKLIHYTHRGGFDTNFHTYFDYMPYGYNIRLPSIFLPLNQKASKEIFQNYYGTFDLISSVPYETIKLLIGDENGTGIPDWLIRNLNYIFHCNEKKIDGVDYELVESSELDVEIVTGYNHRFVSIELCKKDQNSSGGTGGGSIGENPKPPIIITKYDDATKESGTITVFYNDSYYLVPIQEEFYPYNFSTLIAEKNTNISFETVRNTTKTTFITDVEIRNLTTSELLDTVKLELPPTTIGICNWTICEAFFINC
jgi:hypothetical protein